MGVRSLRTTAGRAAALPVLIVPALLGGMPIDSRLAPGLIISLALAVLLVLVGFAVLRWDTVVNGAGMPNTVMWARS